METKMSAKYDSITKEELDTAIKVLEAYSYSEEYFSFYEMDSAIESLIKDFTIGSDKLRSKEVE